MISFSVPNSFHFRPQCKEGPVILLFATNPFISYLLLKVFDETVLSQVLKLIFVVIDIYQQEILKYSFYDLILF